jgi:UDP-3-O-[3-hydroxymyristoyl] glucosamine N-acyltransferase
MEMTLANLAEFVKGRYMGNGEAVISGTASFEDAKKTDITYAGDGRFLSRIEETGAGAVLVPINSGEFKGNIIYVENPRSAFVRLTQMFGPKIENREYIHPSASIGNDVVLGDHVDIRAGVVVGDHVRIGNRVVIQPNTVIGDKVMIGNDVLIHPNVTILERCVIGSRVTIHSGTVIGSDGFGFVPDGESYTKVPHSGIVRVGDDVEIGALNSIDRATYGETVIGNGVKTDNQVHVAHNVIVGDNTLLVAQVGIAGSTTIGNHAILAGQVGVAGHLHIGNNAIIGPKAGVVQSVADNDVVSGVPAIPHKQWMRSQSIVARLPEMKKKLNALEKNVQAMKEKGE